MGWGSSMRRGVPPSKPEHNTSKACVSLLGPAIGMEEVNAHAVFGGCLVWTSHSHLIPPAQSYKFSAALDHWNSKGPFILKCLTKQHRRTGFFCVL